MSLFECVYFLCLFWGYVWRTLLFAGTWCAPVQMKSIGPQNVDAWSFRSETPPAFSSLCIIQAAQTIMPLLFCVYMCACVCRYNGSLPNGDRGRRKSRFALYKRPKANGVKPSTVHVACSPQAAKVNKTQRTSFVIKLIKLLLFRAKKEHSHLCLKTVFMVWLYQSQIKKLQNTYLITRNLSFIPALIVFSEVRFCFSDNSK